MPTREIDLGDRVICDDCAAEFGLASPEMGGILFQRKAICPTCAPKWEASAERYDEMHMIGDRAGPGETFHAAVMRWRGGNNVVRIAGSESFVADMADLFEPKRGV